MRVRSFWFPGATRRGHPATVVLTPPPISEIVLHNVRTRKGKNAVSGTSRVPLPSRMRTVFWTASRRDFRQA